MLHNPLEERLFPTLPPEVLECLRENGRERDLKDGELLFREGDLLQHFYAIMSGRVRVTKRVGSENQLLTIHEPGGFTGEISLLTGEKAIATGQAIGDVHVIEVETRDLQRLTAECPTLSQMILPAMTARAREVGQTLLQQEKLASLGKLSAGLAHELNNPAAAARRAVSHLRESIAKVQRMSIQYDCRYNDGQREKVIKIQEELAGKDLEAIPLDPLARSDQEQEVSEWLDDRGIADAWDLAPSLVETGVTVDCLEQLGSALEGPALEAALSWLDATVRMDDLASEVESSMEKISRIVKDMKEYSFMDQATLQEIDIHHTLESTLRMFSHRLKGEVNVVREYDRTLPKICAHGSELNQVWTNLIDNALDAMNGRGTLTVRTAPACDDMVLVTIADTGPGIPAEIQSRIYDPFFTTKEPGKGTGLGLDTTRRIVGQRHGGTIKVYSQPGDTRFEVRLPRQPPKDNL